MSVEGKLEIRVEGVERVFRGSASQSVLATLAPIHRLEIDAGCRGGGCGVCKVEILDGDVEMGAMSAAHVTEEDKARGIGLACRIYPRTNVTLRVSRKQVWSPFA